MKTRHNKAEYVSHKTEYLMRGKLRQCEPDEAFTFTETDTAPQSSSDEGNKTYTVYHSNSTIGSFKILPYSDGITAYFYGFSIDEPMRGTGIGTRIFRAIKHFLHEQGYEVIVLQVSRSNKAAYHLYKNNGLRITEAV